MLHYLLAAAASAATVQAPAAPPPPVDPLTVTIELGDAERFADIHRRTGGRPDAATLQRDYLDRGSAGLPVFMAGRIRSAAYLAKAVAAKPALYANAIDFCLPLARSLNPELRSIYLGLHGLLPDRELPRIYLVVGANNSGGTAAPGAQVLGLEVLCAISGGDPAKFRGQLRHFFAHETVHALQRPPADLTGVSPLLLQVLTEGAADFVAALVTGEQPDPARAAWAAPQEAALFRQFEADVAATADLDPSQVPGDDPRMVRLRRWVWNYQNAPAGWPSEAGYWIGQRIWERWYAAQPDKHAAIRAMLDGTAAPAVVLRAGAHK